MKTIVILFADYRSDYLFEKAFDGKSSVELCLSVMETFGEVCFVCNSKEVYDRISKTFPDKMNMLCDENKIFSLFEMMDKICKTKECENAFFAFADSPLVNLYETKEILKTHEDFLSEYTFSDGYCSGLTPELLNAGTISILKELSRDTYKSEGEREISRTGIFDFIKTDINSFEVETVIAEEDYRLLRLEFNTSTKLNFLSCVQLYDIIKEKKLTSINSICQEAKNSCQVLKTVPSYYEIQICPSNKYSSIYIPHETQQKYKDFMSLEKFNELMDKIKIFSDKPYICLSCFAEPLAHPDFEKIVQSVVTHGFKLLIETDGLLVTEELAEKIKNISSKIIWIVRLDAVTKETYGKINENSLAFENAVNSISILSGKFEKSVYPQFVRTSVNEDELENFFRYWNEKTNPSEGNLIVKKYSSFCSLLKDLKPSDLSPVERNPCYHLRRDMFVFPDGSVPLCKEMLFENIIANVFTQNLDEIFSKMNEELENHIKNNYCEKCRKCDEYYTFNF